MFCQNCGQELSSDAKFCWKCGKPTHQASQNNAAQNGFLVIKRKSNPRNTAPAEIWINGSKARIIQDGETVTLTLHPAFYSVVIEQVGQESLTYSVEVRGGETKTLLYEPAASSMTRSVSAPASAPAPVAFGRYGTRTCPRCGGLMTTHMLTESRKAGCGTVLLYFLLACTILGLFIVIPLALRKKTETVTYVVCQSCGYQREISRT